MNNPTETVENTETGIDNEIIDIIKTQEEIKPETTETTEEIKEEVETKTEFKKKSLFDNLETKNLYIDKLPFQKSLAKRYIEIYETKNTFHEKIRYGISKSFW
jgi:hypothetical protein